MNSAARYRPDGYQEIKTIQQTCCPGEEHQGGCDEVVTNAMVIYGDWPVCSLIQKDLGVPFYRPNGLEVIVVNVIVLYLYVNQKSLILVTGPGGGGSVLGTSWVKQRVWEFGNIIKKPFIAEVVCSLYDAALQETSQKTYKTGQRAYMRFAKEVWGSDPPTPFRSRCLSPTELHLAFFMAWLLLQPTISSASTILGYEVHAKYMFKEQGCDPE